LEPGGEVRCFTDDRLFLCRAFADQIADDHQPNGNPNARLELGGFDIEVPDRVDGAQPRPDRPLGIILMRPRVAEIDQHPIAHVLGNKTLEPRDGLGDGAMIGVDDPAQVLGVEARRECGRADQVAEHHCELPPLRLHPHPSLPRRRSQAGRGG
jgi:hypothetical protein